MNARFAITLVCLVIWGHTVDVARATDVKFSVHHGIYNAPVTVTLSTDVTGPTIYYTTDGSVPAPGNGTAINAQSGTLPPFANTTMLRAVVYQGGVAVTPVRTATYIRPPSITGQPVLPAGYPATWNGVAADYEMDPDVLQATQPGYGLTDGLMSIPSVSIVMNHNDLWSAANGIYIFPTATGGAWERPCSMEMIYPDGRPGFQINSCVEIHGNWSRDHNIIKKHSFRFSFKSSCGASDLEYPLFPGCSRQRFDRLVLRALSTDTWAIVDGTPIAGNPDTTLRWKRESASFIRDQWMRDTQIAMGHVAAHGMFVHVFLNGLYWGLYNLVEHFDDDDNFHATHEGGKERGATPSDYAAFSQNEPVEGGWNALVTLVQQAAGTQQANLDAYETIKGNNPDGSRNPAAIKYLDIENFIDYMILHIGSSADDWPNNNWHTAQRLDVPDFGFRFYAWDQEISNIFLQKTRNSYSPFPLFQQVAAANTPAFFYDRLRVNPRFIQDFKERISLHYFNFGVLSVENSVYRWQQRALEIDKAVVLESARWGDARNATPYTRQTHWAPSNLVWMVNIYWPQMRTISLNRFASVNLYNANDPSLPAAPMLLTPDCTFRPGFQVQFTDINTPAGTIFYTTDGSDPRLANGNVSPSAAAYNPNTGIALTLSTRIRARVRVGAVWSPIVKAEFTQDFSHLSITEIHYHPAANVSQDAEFLEFKNVGKQVLGLQELGFRDGIAYSFPPGQQLNPGQFFVLAKNTAAFLTVYPFNPSAAFASGSLDNAGERLMITNRLGRTILSLSYADSAPWPVAADGAGPSLVPLTPVSNPNSRLGTLWRPSNQIHGSPGQDDDIGEVAWFEDNIPAGATPFAQIDSWANWVTANPTPYSGAAAIQSAIGGANQLHQLFFTGASSEMTISEGDTLYAYVYIDPQNPPREVMLQWHDSFGIWEHRAYWGLDLMNWFGGRTFMGPLPAFGRWVRLEVPASSVDLEGRLVTGMAFTLYEGRATWDHAGKRVVGDILWVNDDTPTEVDTLGEVGDFWSNWSPDWPTPPAGVHAFQSGDFARQDQALLASADQRLHQVYFYDVKDGWYIRSDDTLVAYVHLDQNNPPQEIMLQWLDSNYDWTHRVFWGPDLMNWFGPRTTMGAVPPAGAWQRLEIPAPVAGLAGKTIIGMAMTAYDGHAAWDALGKGETVWMEDAPPVGATLGVIGTDNWNNWVAADPPPRSGAAAVKSSVSGGLHQLHFSNVPNDFVLATGDKLFAHVFPDPLNTPATVMLQWLEAVPPQGIWHVAYWGAPPAGFPTAINMGPLPTPGQWTRLSVPAWALDLEGSAIDGMAFSLIGGRATWDRAGRTAR